MSESLLPTASRKVRHALRLVRTKTPVNAWRPQTVDQRQNHLSAYWFTSVRNFGDLVGPAIVEYITGTRPGLAHGDSTGKLLTVGSILANARFGDTVWGSGAIHDQRVDVAGVTVLALRGPLSMKLTHAHPSTPLGDPALLLPTFYTPRPVTHQRIGFVPHYVDLPIAASLSPDAYIIDVTARNWRTTVDAITACDVVVSSSLHGLIVAEAYGVPAVWSRTHNPITGNDFKFRDYFAATSRELPRPVGPTFTEREIGDRISRPPHFATEPLVDALQSWFSSLPA
ncbi:MAG: polysaccharide pyruvyl transferase family protein [Actinobacteria bacterium]|nr:polysaccharide pyruvyl transferase family protein [Actinomycetota bacterium]